MENKYIILYIELIKENNANLEMCKKYNQRYILVDDKYEIDFELSQ